LRVLNIISIVLSSLPPDTSPVNLRVDLSLLPSMSYIVRAIGVGEAAVYYVCALESFRRTTSAITASRVPATIVSNG
jgi:hypothetical protein